jgi:hypothetical protein
VQGITETLERKIRRAGDRTATVSAKTASKGSYRGALKIYLDLQMPVDVVNFDTCSTGEEFGRENPTGLAGFRNQKMIPNPLGVASGQHFLANNVQATALQLVLNAT